MTHGHHHGGGGHENGHDHYGDLLDLDAELNAPSWAQALDRVALAAPHARHVVDLGTGTGTGALGLLTRLPQATLTAVDVDGQSLARLTAKAVAAGVGDRLRTLAHDLDAATPAFEPAPDLVFASMSLHHLADPARTLADVAAGLAPGGVVALYEFDSSPLVLRQGTAWGDLEARLQAGWDAERAEHLPFVDAAWPQRLRAAGLEVVEQTAVSLALGPPYPEALEAHARTWFGRMAQGVSERLDPADRDALARLVEGDTIAGLIRDGDVDPRGERTLTVARRPG